MASTLEMSGILEGSDESQQEDVRGELVWPGRPVVRNYYFYCVWSDLEVYKLVSLACRNLSKLSLYLYILYRRTAEANKLYNKVPSGVIWERIK